MNSNILTEAWQQQHERLRQWTKAATAAAKFEKPPEWYRPELNGWSGDLFDGGEDQQSGIAKAFSAEECAEALKRMFRSADSMGSIGEAKLLYMQGEMLASMERAFRERHKQWPKALAHAAGRNHGQQHEKGVLEVCIKKQWQDLAKAAAGEQS